MRSPGAATLGLIFSTSPSDRRASADLGDSSWHAQRAIWVRPGRSLADMITTLAHELAHALRHEAMRSMSRSVREGMAELIAYAVCSLAGLEMELRSVAYVASWLDDPDAFKEGMAAIHAGAASFITTIEAAQCEADTCPLAA